MKKKHFIAAALSLAMITASVLPASAGSVSSSVAQNVQNAPEQTEQEPAQSQALTDSYKALKEKTSARVCAPSWVKRNGAYYWKQEDGTLYKKKGWFTLGNNKYYLNSGGSRVSGWKKVSGEYYYFRENGILYKKKGWLTLGKYKYYIKSDGSRATGIYKVGSKYYYLTSAGKLSGKKSVVKVGNYYYTVSEKGVAQRISAAKAQCILETQKFISNHTNSSMSNSQKFRACYNYLLAYMNYRPRPFNSNDFVGEDWPYTWALSVYQSGLTGNCYGFACCVAACAKELGYTPYVIITTGDHGFVMIDGKYYDNMGALFGASSHSSYNILHKVKF